MPETKTLVVPSSPADLKRIKDAAREASDCYIRIESEKEQIKAIVDKIVEDLDLPKAYVNKMFRTYHKSSFDKESQEQEDFATLYESVFNLKQPTP